MGYTLLKLRDRPDWAERAAQWYHQKWQVPIAAYRESIQACLQGQEPVPQWYLFLDGEGKIAAGAGVIENDFHDRPDLRPNLCALFVEEPHRERGLARRLLNAIREDMGSLGEKRLYLVTDHIGFYEKCGWEFCTMVNCTDGETSRLYTIPTLCAFQTGKSRV